MKRDPFYQQIVSGLSQLLDPDVFERCAADLLRDEWPTLVPVRGGGDAGMDGAVADGEGNAFPLVCTTGQDVIGNLTRSLASYVRSGGDRRRVLLATSQELTPRRRQNLEKRASEKGFALQQIYTQAAIADRLYRNPPWCRELLNLTGTPPALSVIPPTTRPLLDVPLIGRTDDAAWLRAQTGDRLIVGQPGCGKTFLLQDLAKSDGGLFVVGEDRGEITAALRAQHPRALILDDAHVHLELLAGLRQMREETGLSFSLVACSWPGQEHEVREALNLSAAQVRSLDLLTRDQILAVVRSVGIFGPDELLRELVDQAEGRPGLAVTLSHLCLQGGVREIALGDALSRSIRTTFEPLVGQHATELLAGFAVGGRSGMRMSSVASVFTLPLIQVRRDVARLAAGGVIRQLPEDRLAVSPPGLCYALVRDLFFQGSLSLPLMPFVAEAPNLSEVVRTLIGARIRGGDVPDDLLLPLLENLNRSDLWGEYAALGRRETAFVLGHRSDLSDAVAGPALHYQPDEALTRLLDAASAEAEPSKSLKLVQEWVRTAEPGSGEAVHRRRSVISAVQNWYGQSGPPATDGNGTEARRAQAAAQAIAYALSPRFERTSMDPGRGMTLRISSGALSLPETREMGDLWSEAVPILRRIPPLYWKAVMQATDDWAHPSRHGAGDIHPEITQAMQDLARRMIGDLAPFLSGHPGLHTTLRERAERLGIPIAAPEDDDFDTLFPGRSQKDWREAEQENQAAVQVLADRWALLDPHEAAARVKRYEEEADLADLTWPRLTQPLCYELATRVPGPSEWAGAFAQASLPNNLSRPFLEAAINNRSGGWEALVSQFLRDPNQRGAALLAVLTMPAPPSGLLDEALAFVGDYPQLVDTCCLRNEVPAATIRRLLNHEQPAVAVAAATGLWTAEPRGVILEELRSDWRRAVLQISSEEYWLGEILSADPALTVDWLHAWLAEAHGYILHFGDAVQSPVRSLPEAIRIGLLPLVPDLYGADELIGWIVGDSPAVFDALLHTSHLKQHHLAPIGNANDERVAWMAAQAFSNGYSVAEVANALVSTPRSWMGDESLMWQQCADRFARIAESEDERLKQAAEAARDCVLRQRDDALARERAEAVYGRRR